MGWVSAILSRKTPKKFYLDQNNKTKHEQYKRDVEDVWTIFKDAWETSNYSWLINNGVQVGTNQIYHIF